MPRSQPDSKRQTQSSSSLRESEVETKPIALCLNRCSAKSQGDGAVKAALCAQSEDGENKKDGFAKTWSYIGMVSG